MPRPSVVIALVALGSVAFVGQTWANFSKTTSNDSNVVTAKRIFPTTETTTAWDVSDQASGTATNVSDQGALAGDGRTFNTGSWGSAYSATRYTETTFASPLPDGLSISNLAFNFAYKGTNAADTVCLYFEVRRTSNGALLGSHGSTTTPVRTCTTGTGAQSFSEPLPEITTSADANDLTVRVYATVSGSRPITVDQGVITGTASNGFGSFTLNETKYVDRATGTAFSFPYGPAATDATSATYSAWATTFSTTRFLKFTFPTAFVPTGATITGVTYTNTYRSSVSGKSTCVYYEFWNGATQVTSRGSSTSSYSCSDTANNWKTDSISLPEVNTAAEVNGLFVKLFGKDTGSVSSVHDVQTITVSYYLD